MDQKINSKELSKRLEKKDEVILLDIRTEEEFQSGHIPGALNIDFYAYDFINKIQELPKDKDLVLYCFSGNRSNSTMGLLQHLGFRSVLDLRGGIEAWVSQGFDVTKD